MIFLHLCFGIKLGPCVLYTARRFIHANLIYAATCANLSVIFPCRLAKTFGSTSEATCQEQPSREDVVLHFLPIPLLCSQNQFTSAIFAKAWPYKNGWMKWHEYTIIYVWIGIAGMPLSSNQTGSMSHSESMSEETVSGLHWDLQLSALSQRKPPSPVSLHSGDAKWTCASPWWNVCEM